MRALLFSLLALFFVVGCESDSQAAAREAAEENMDADVRDMDGLSRAGRESSFEGAARMNTGPGTSRPRPSLDTFPLKFTADDSDNWPEARFEWTRAENARISGAIYETRMDADAVAKHYADQMTDPVIDKAERGVRVTGKSKEGDEIEMIYTLKEGRDRVPEGEEYDAAKHDYAEVEIRVTKWAESEEEPRTRRGE